MYTIEPATHDDLEDILSVQKEAFIRIAERTGNYSLHPLTQTLDELMEEAERSFVLKAVLHGKIVGSVRASAEGSRALIKRLVVLPEEQGRGIGTALLKAAEEHYYSDDSITQYYLFTDSSDERAISFYEKLGYKPYKYEKVSDVLTFIYLMKSKSERT